MVPAPRAGLTEGPGGGHRATLDKTVVPVRRKGKRSLSVLNRMVLGLGGLAAFFWLASYSWIVGLALPTHWIWPDVSPWLIAELAAVVVGAVS